MVTKKTLGFLIALIALTASCTETKTTDTAPAAQLAGLAPVSASVDFIEQQNEDIPFNADMFTHTLEQIHYVMPVTKSDILDESAILIEGETGVFPNLSEVRSCLKAFSISHKDAEIPLHPSIVKASTTYWSGHLKTDDHNTELTAIANGAFKKCAISDNKTCSQSCETYAAISAVMAGPKGIKHLQQ